MRKYDMCCISIDADYSFDIRYGQGSVFLACFIEFNKAIDVPELFIENVYVQWREIQSSLKVDKVIFDLLAGGIKTRNDDPEKTLKLKNLRQGYVNRSACF